LYVPDKIKSSGVSLVNHANLVAFNPKSAGPFILLQGHIDTVPAFSDYKTLISDRDIKGRGAVDMKGPLAGMMDAFIEMYHKKDLGYSPILLITADEEANSFAGILNFIKKYKKILKMTKLAINGEPTNFDVYTNFRGIYGYVIEKAGKEGHSAYPSDGTIIEKMILMIGSIDKFIIEARKIKDRKLGETIGAFTVLNSGKKVNQLPGNFLAGFSLRTVRPFSEYDKLFKKVVGQNIPSGSKIKKMSIDPISVEINSRHREVLIDAFANSEIKYNEDIARYFSEANILNREGVKTITFGPGNPELAHVVPEKEVIKINDIKKYSKLLQEIIKNLND
jgi:acetylornithine deacetylase/succinyl-diaminopimelate desuccinylase-like protein